MTARLATAGCWVFVCGASGAGKDSVIALGRNARIGPTRGDFVACNNGVPEVAGKALQRHLEALAGPAEPGA